MLVCNDKSCKFEAYFKICEYTKGRHSATTMNCGVFQKINIELKYNFS